MISLNGSGPSDTASGGGKRPSVLVVDDDAGLRGLARAVLSEEYDVRTAEHGAEALSALNDDPVDVIVLDLQMPVLDGRGFFRALRAQGDTTPVLLASSYGVSAAKRQLGAEAAIEKPFGPDTLLREVARLIG